jgi:hypothetical protein
VTEDITKLMEELTGISAPTPSKRLTRKEKKEQAGRVRRFLALPPPLQEGILRYGERLREAYSQR